MRRSRGAELQSVTAENQYVALSCNPFTIPFLQKGVAVTVVGSSGQFLSQYEVLPRFRGDIRPAVP